MTDKIDLFDGIDFDDIGSQSESVKTFARPPVNAEYDDPDKFEYDDYENLDVKEQQEKIRKLQIGNEKELRTLIEKKLMVSIMGEIGQSIQSNLVDQAKRNANKWANKLGIPSKERDIEKLISDMLEDGINGVISDIERLCDDGLFE